jgi:signal transduction histidine kinase
VRKERKGPLGAVAGLAEDLMAGMRRRQEEREPRVVVYDAGGHPRVIPEGMERDRLLDIADELIDLSREAERR